jgi:hypothetical protein
MPLKNTGLSTVKAQIGKIAFDVSTPGRRSGSRYILQASTYFMLYMLKSNKLVKLYINSVQRTLIVNNTRAIEKFIHRRDR